LSRTCLRCNNVNEDADLLKKGGVVKSQGKIDHFRCVRCWTPVSWKPDKKPTHANKEVSEHQSTWQYANIRGQDTNGLHTKHNRRGRRHQDDVP
jgi:hypothetical protein